MIDTPGLGDTDGKDLQNITEMICSLQTIKFVNTFVITFNYETHRLDQNTQEIVALFIKMFGNGF